jgi:hypothetical protein
MQGSVAQSLNYFDDDDYINKVDIDSEDEFWSSFPRNQNSWNFIMVGPQRPDTMGMTPAEEEAAMKKYKKRKSFMDKQHVKLMKSVACKDVAASLQKSQVGFLGGDQNKMIQIMADVKSGHLLQNHLFQLKKMLQLHIAEEANLHQIKVKTIRSDHNIFILAGSNFHVYATYSVQLGWVVRATCCREGDDTSPIPPDLRYINDKVLQIRFKSKWVAPVLWTTIKDTPGLLRVQHWQ